MFSNDSRMCSSTIEAILTALLSVVKSNWKSIATTPSAHLPRRAGRCRHQHVCAAVHSTLQPPVFAAGVVHAAVLVVAQGRPHTAKPMAEVFGGLGPQPLP
ncbi:hypothetical protein I551_7016 [Mycobacterium ulcerans str. Harvey]|uniref:Uncharacterized protein n=1 Tax=Mycobacterium ulcerans str. Harvey TaxID=1299332 RepID=A0ABP3A4Y8_MYCUL|nr:hypothetical protein I551_7016 [Mycobacterium ulcerans str. Harvey]